MDIDQKEAYREVLVILDNMEDEYKNKVPQELINFFKRNEAKEYVFKLDNSIPLTEQRIKEKTLSLLAILNLNYWCSTDERKELIKKYSDNERKFREEVDIKYHVDELLRKYDIKHKDIEEKATIDNKVAVKYKESLLQKLINKIKKIFTKNK